jgi:hypothetical protein
MKQNTLSLAHALALMSIIALIFTPVGAEDNITGSSADVSLVEKNVSEEVAQIFSKTLPFEFETVSVVANSGHKYDVNAATPLGRLALAALEEDSFTYVIGDESFELSGTLLLISIDDYISGEDGSWVISTYTEIIPNNQINITIIDETVFFKYIDADSEPIAIIEIGAEELIDEIDEEIFEDVVAAGEVRTENKTEQ